MNLIQRPYAFLYMLICYLAGIKMDALPEDERVDAFTSKKVTEAYQGSPPTRFALVRPAPTSVVRYDKRKDITIVLQEDEEARSLAAFVGDIKDNTHPDLQARIVHDPSSPHQVTVCFEMYGIHAGALVGLAFKGSTIGATSALLRRAYDAVLEQAKISRGDRFPQLPYEPPLRKRK